MTSNTLPNTSAVISTRAARLAIAAIVTYQVLLMTLIRIRPDLDPAWHTISEWAIGPPTAGSCQGHFSFQQRATPPYL
jgi:hypothetical protein